jgi:hypothetical protein
MVTLMGWTYHGRNDLPHVRFSSAGIYTQGTSHLLKEATVRCSDKTRQRLVEG